MIFELIFGVFLEVVGGAIFEALAAFLGRPLDKAEAHLGCGWLVKLPFFGFAVGLASKLLFDERVFDTLFFPGLSLIIVPIAGGLTMHLLGRYILPEEYTRTMMFTFPGGALFAFSFAFARFIVFYQG